MNHAEFIIPAYALTIGGLVALLVVTWLRMRTAEKAAERLREPRR